MSYLNFPRLTFSGEFQADVSTVNNDPRHFDTSTFEPEFQDFQISRPNNQTQFNGWWNPIGTGIFRLSGCNVTALLGPNGDAADDLAIGCSVGNSPDRPSGKLVDIDPDWQLASCIFGLTVSLTDANGNIVMQGDYQPNPFRDLWFNRAPQSVPGDTRASAMFQSVLTNVRWNLEAIHSPFLQALKEASETGMLSIRLTIYGYTADNAAPGFSYGKVVGVIGPAYADEPGSFILGRRFMPYVQNPPPYQGQPYTLNPNAGQPGQLPQPAYLYNTGSPKISCFSSIIDQATNTLQVDLSNALPLDADFKIENLGTLQFVVLNDASIMQGATVGPDDYVVLGTLDCSQAAQDVYSGIQALPISDAARELMGDHPLALIQPNASGSDSTVCIMETPYGLEVRAEQFAFRLDPNDPAANQLESTVYAAKYGKRIANPQLSILVNPPMADDQNGDCPPSIPLETNPQAAMPTNNIPSLAIQMTINHDPVQNQNGKVKVTFQGPQTMGIPRGYMDGQLYSISYNFAGIEQAVQQQFDCFAVLVFSSFEAPAVPTWADVQPILQQYANLYPVMSKGLFDFSKQEVADASAFIMHFVFSKDFDDPDYMPVTRDLSASKRKMLLDYFAGVMKSSKPIEDTQKMFATRCPMGFSRKPAAD